MKTKSKINYLKQAGITLIALVVTIVVLLILAGVSLNAIFSENGIIKRAQDAQNKMDQATQNDLDSVNSLNEWIDEQTNETTINKNIPVVIPTTDTEPYYPDETFTKEEETDLDNGLVIKDTIGNEYVWIEVPKSLYNNEAYNTETSTGDQKPSNSTDYAKIEYCLHKYTDYYRDGTSFADTYCSDDVTGLTETQYYDLKQKMLKSVYENGGFWIGRYEAGITENRIAEGDATVAPLSKQGTVENPIYPYTYVTCSQAQTLASQLSTGKSYTSSLMFGVQWDLVLKYLEVKEVAKGTELAIIQGALKSDSKDWGNDLDASFKISRGKYAKIKDVATWYNYNTTLTNYVTCENGISTKVSNTNMYYSILLTTGASDTCKKMNIYDLAGNVSEWTLEYTASTYTPCTSRGGNCAYKGSVDSASKRGIFRMANSSDQGIGFRVTLYK